MDSRPTWLDSTGCPTASSTNSITCVGRRTLVCRILPLARRRKRASTVPEPATWAYFVTAHVSLLRRLRVARQDGQENGMDEKIMTRRSYRDRTRCRHDRVRCGRTRCPPSTSGSPPAARASCSSNRPTCSSSPGLAPAAPSITVTPTTTFQTIDGFGAALTDSSAWLIQNELTQPQRDKLMRQLYLATGGIGLNYLRVPMGASDFTASGYYTYNDNPPGGTDEFQQHFSVAHDEAYIIPQLQQARALNPGLEADGIAVDAPRPG